MKNYICSFSVFRCFLANIFLVRATVIISYFLICVICLFLYELIILPELPLNSTSSSHSYCGEYALPHNSFNAVRFICSVAEEATQDSKNVDEDSNLDGPGYWKGIKLIGDWDYNFDPEKDQPKKERVLMEGVNDDLNDFYLWSWHLPAHAQYLILQDNRFFFDALCYYVENTGSFIPNRIVYGDLDLPITDIEWYIKYLQYFERPATPDESMAVFGGPNEIAAGINFGIIVLAVAAIIMGFNAAAKY